VVRGYLRRRSGTYAETSELFAVGEASVSRWLRRERAGQSLDPRHGGGPPRRVDLEWLREHAKNHADARLIDRIAAWQAQSGMQVAVGTMWNALRNLGFTHKKKRR